MASRRLSEKPGVPFELDCSFLGEHCASHARASRFGAAGRPLQLGDKIEVSLFMLS